MQVWVTVITWSGAAKNRISVHSSRERAEIAANVSINAMLSEIDLDRIAPDADSNTRDEALSAIDDYWSDPLMPSEVTIKACIVDDEA